VRGAFDRVVLGVGDTAEGSEAVAFAFREAEVRESSRLHAVRAWRCPALELPDVPVVQGTAPEPHLRAAEQALYSAVHAPAGEHPAVAVLQDPFEGPAREALLNAAATADLLVVGARRRDGTLGMQLGPVNHAVLHHASCPVAVVPEPA
jgi:nucleotide-binding universal stress UspA family protein